MAETPREDRGRYPVRGGEPPTPVVHVSGFTLHEDRHGTVQRVDATASVRLHSNGSNVYHMATVSYVIDREGTAVLDGFETNHDDRFEPVVCGCLPVVGEAVLDAHPFVHDVPDPAEYFTDLLGKAVSKAEWRRREARDD